MKSLLIVSPYFPPANAADMHRVRQSVWYYQALGWVPTVVAVHPDFYEIGRDEMLNQTLPKDLILLHIKALPQRITRMFGLGSIAFRSLYYYMVAVNRLLKTQKFDLIFFSTTQFPVIVLGSYWKWRFGVPYVVDMQDPWYSPTPKNNGLNGLKHRAANLLNKWLEPMALQNCAGVMAVSKGYITILQKRYTHLGAHNTAVIPFGALEKDFEVVSPFLEENFLKNHLHPFKNEAINGLYIGRGGPDMHKALHIIFEALRIGLDKNPAVFGNIHLTFLGTSYAPDGKGKKSIEPIALEHNIANHVREFAQRIPYFQALHTLKNADFLLIPGSDDPNYTASKIYPYILAKRPLLAVFNVQSSVVDILKSTQAGEYVTFDSNDTTQLLAQKLYETWESMLKKLPFTPHTDWQAFSPYTAHEMTRKQVEFFNRLIT